MYRGEIDPMVSGMFGFRLPLHRKGKQQEAVAQTGAELDASERDVEAAELRLLSEVRGLVAEAEAARTAMLLHAEGLIPQSQSALDAAVASYASGRTEFVTVIASFRVMLAAELGHEERRAQEVVALTALEALTGATLVVPSGGNDE
jgi:outer membrane protein TolC